MNKKVLLLGVLLLLIAGTSGFAYNYVDAIEKSLWFFDANKCGPDVDIDNVNSDWRSACHTTDSDGSIDLTGGYHDAGDHVKFGLPQFWTASMMGWTLYEYRDMFDDSGLTPKTLSILKYMTDFILKCHPNANTFYYEVGEGNIDHGYWGPPETQTGERPVKQVNSTYPGSDVCGQAAAALALMYLNYQSTNSSYANQCLTAAQELYDLGNSRYGRCDHGSFYDSSSHFDDLCWAAVWLNVAGGPGSLLDDVEYWLDNEQNDYGDDNYAKEWSPAWDDCTVPVLVKMAQLTNITKFRYGVQNNLEWYRDDCTKTPYGLPWLDSWGVLRYASSEAGIGYMAYKLLSYEGFLDTGELIMDYCLGTNPRNGSFVTNYLSNPPQHPHHRANEPNRDGNTYGMVGALVGGPNSSDGYTDSVDDYTMNEVALDYNASFIMGLAGIAWMNGGGPPDPTPTIDPSITPTPTPGGADGDIKVQYICAETGDSATQIKPHLNIVNDSYDAVTLSDLTLRYYYTKDTLGEEEFHVDYAAVGSSNVTGTFYEDFVEIGFTSGAGDLAANSETGIIQARVNRTAWTAYDQTNDYSFDPSYTSFADYSKITMYRNGDIIWGYEEGYNDEPTDVPTNAPTQAPTDVPTDGPTVAPTDIPTAAPTSSVPEAGQVWFVPQDQTVGLNEAFTTELHINSGDQLFAAYGLDINFDQGIINVDTSVEDTGVTEGADGFIAAANSGTPGLLTVSGFDASGTGPGEDLHALTIHWLAVDEGTTVLDLTIDELVDETANTIGVIQAIDGSVTVTDVLMGDVDGDGDIDIIDALLCAQYYVDLNPDPFNPDAGDVDCDGDVDIIDALLIAQYYVDLIDEFTC